MFDSFFFFFFQAEDGIRDYKVTGVQTCALPICIREIEFGQLDGIDGRGIEMKYPEEAKRRAKEGKYFYRPPGGEYRPDVRIRIRSFLDTIVRDCRGLNVLVVCHSVVVLSFRALLERWGEVEYLQVDKENDVKNASVTHYQFEGKLLLKEYNSVFYPERHAFRAGR